MPGFPLQSLGFRGGGLWILIGLMAGGCTWKPGTYGLEAAGRQLSGLVASAGPHPEAEAQTWLSAAFRSPAVEVKLAALEAWAAGLGDEFPAAVRDLLRDVNPRLRAAAAAAIGRRAPGGAATALLAALTDHDLQVKIAAIEALGELGGPEAQAPLEGLLADRGELIRAAAVRALARAGAPGPLLRAKRDASWRVRLEVAKALLSSCTQPASVLARELVRDPSPAVQLQVVRSVGQWPLEHSGPVLLEAIGQETYATRREAARQLAALWPPAAEFPVDGTPQQRAEVLRVLEGRFRQEVGPAQAPNTVEAPESSGGNRPGLEPGPGPKARGPTRDDPAFAALEDLRSTDVAVRRRGADRLAALARQQALGSALRSRLAALLANESDPLVWQSGLRAVAKDGSGESIWLAYQAMRHSSAEVRRGACEHLARHPSPSHAEILLAALEDPHPMVVIAALRALGAVGRLDQTAPLKGLLASPSEQVRLEAATALARVGDPAGAAALERLAYSLDPAIRRQVAAAMGELGDPSFAWTLVRLLDDQHAVRLAALQSLPKLAKGDAAGPPPAPSGTVAEQIEYWKRAFRGEAASHPRQ